MPVAKPPSKQGVTFTKIPNFIWKDTDFQGLSSDAKQVLFQALTSETDLVGVFLYDAQALADQHPDLTGEQAQAAFDEISAKGFFVSSAGSPLVFFRDWFLWNPQHHEQPNAAKSALIAIDAIRRKDVRSLVAKALFSRAADVAKMDKTPINSKIVASFRDYATKWDVRLPSTLAPKAFVDA